MSVDLEIELNSFRDINTLLSLKIISWRQEKIEYESILHGYLIPVRRYKSLPRIRKARKRLISKGKTQKSTLSQFFATVNCVICQDVSTSPVCSKCQNNEQWVVALLSQNISRIQRKEFLLNKVCSSCCGRADDLLCDSLNCPVYYRKCLSKVSLREMDFLQEVLNEF